MKVKHDEVQEFQPDERTDDMSQKSKSRTESLKELLYYYASSTTLHCISHFGNRDYTWWRRVFWVVLFLVLIYIFIDQIYRLIIRFYEYKTVTKETSIFENEPEFPTLTICNLNKMENNSVTDPEIRRLLEETFMKPLLNVSYFESLNPSFLASVNLTHYFLNQSRVASTAVSCQWQKERIPCRKYFSSVGTDFGECLAFNSKDFIKKNGGALRTCNIGSEEGLIVGLMAWQDQYFIGDSAAAGFKVTIHGHDEEPSIREIGVSISPGTSAAIGLKKIEKIYLPSPVKAFGEQYCLDTESSTFRNSLKYYEKYSYQGCMLECESDYTFNACGCISFLQPGHNRVCNAYEYRTCIIQAKANFSRYRASTCSCSLPCKIIEYDLRVSTAWFPRDNFVETMAPDSSFSTTYLRQNLVELRVYFQSKLYTQQTQVLELTDGDVYAALGGYMGLCFGASIGTIFEILQLIIHTCYTMLKRR